MTGRPRLSSSISMRDVSNSTVCRRESSPSSACDCRSEDERDFSAGQTSIQMRLVPSDYYTLHRPSKCGLRVYLRNRGVAEAEPRPLSQVLLRLRPPAYKGHTPYHLAA